MYQNITQGFSYYVYTVAIVVSSLNAVSFLESTLGTGPMCLL